MIDVSKFVCILDFMGRSTSDRPLSLRSRTLGNVMPPTGPKLDDLREESICGDDVECFSARRCKIGGRLGDCGISSVDLSKSALFVLRLNWLGLRFIDNIGGLINDGEDGSSDGTAEDVVDAKGG